MTARAPLVVDAGQVKQLPVGDQLSVVAGVPWKVPSGVTIVVPQYVQAPFSMPIAVDGFLRVDGFLVELDLRPTYPTMRGLQLGGM